MLLDAAVTQEPFKTRVTLIFQPPDRLLSAMSAAKSFFKDALNKPEILPVSAIVWGAGLGAASFIVWKITHTPDVQVNPAAAPNYESYKGQEQHPHNTKSKVL